jgi:DNA gyrase subunit A
MRLSHVQAEAIGALRLIQLVGLELENLVDQIKAIAEEIDGYLRILGDETVLMDIIREDIFELKEKYGDARRTEITGDVSAFNMESLIAQEDVVVTVSHEGYIKRLPVGTYRAQTRGGRGIKGTESKEGDFVEHLFVANTHDFLLFFTNQGRVYERRVYDVPEGSRTSQGRSVANLLEFQPGEKIANVLAVKDFNKGEQFLLFATRKGVVKKTALAAYGNINRRGIIAIGLEEGDELIGVEITDGKDQILLGTRHGMAIRFNETDARPMGRPAGGVKGIELEADDAVVSMIVVPHGQPPETCMVLTGCVNGFGKRTPVEDYRLIRRGGKGVINIKTTDRNGDVVGMQAVCDEDELMLITEKGILIRTRVAEIRETGRNAAGVKLIKLDEGDKLVAMAKVDAAAVEETPSEGADPAAPDAAGPPEAP